jgi:hypothetical protein
MNGLRSPGLVRHLVRHPVDGVVVMRAGWRLRREGWLRHWPYLPLPDDKYWHFRMVTVNGTAGDAVSPASVIDAAKWAVAQPVGRRS